MKSFSVTIQMKATEQYFHVVLFLMQHKIVSTLNFGIKININLGCMQDTLHRLQPTVERLCRWISSISSSVDQ